jgi:glyoxylase-like metal-dependent hydrolase (beta-lactamase superfamily II)
MNIKVLSVGPYEANCTVLWRDPEMAWVIDPGANAGTIHSALSGSDLKLGVVVLTHSHFDHISALTQVLDGREVPVYMHKADEAFAFSPMNSMPPYPQTQKPGTLNLDKNDGDQIECGGLTARLIATPGHTPGGWCLYFEDHGVLVAGDTLFAGSVGRTDLPGGDWNTLSESLQKLKKLPDSTRVICGHGPETTIGKEKQHNPYL